MEHFKGRFSIDDLRGNRINTVMLLILSCIVGLTVAYSGYFNYRVNRPRGRDVTSVVEYMNDNSDYVYVCSYSSRLKFINYKLTLSSENYKHKPVYNINGDWFIYTDYWYSMMEELGLEEYEDSTFKALLDPRVRYLANDKEIKIMDRILVFFKEHYGIEAHYEAERTFEGTDIKLYSFVEN